MVPPEFRFAIVFNMDINMDDETIIKYFVGWEGKKIRLYWIPPEVWKR
jgi:hypothetical protein